MKMQRHRRSALLKKVSQGQIFDYQMIPWIIEKHY